MAPRINTTAYIIGKCDLIINNSYYAVAKYVRAGDFGVGGSLVPRVFDGLNLLLYALLARFAGQLSK